jgi:hypothetical protein
MSHSSQTERRQEARFPQSFGVALRELPRIGSADSAETKTISGRALNLSDTGLCLVTSAPVGRFSLVRCEIEIGNPRQKIATLMQVRWIHAPASADDSFMSGLQAIL